MYVLLNVFGVGVSCRILYSIDSYLYVSCSGPITSVMEERASLTAIVYLWLCGFCSGGVFSSSGCLGWAAFLFIVALPEPSI